MIFHLTIASIFLTALSMESQPEPSNFSQPIQIRIYDGFAEIRRPVTIVDGHVSVVFHRDDFDRIVRDSIDLETDAEKRVSLRLTEHRNSFEGHDVFVRNERTGESRRSVLIDDEDSLVQDAETKRFLYVRPSMLEYHSKPMKNIVKAVFTVANPSTDIAVLTYTDRSIRWSPQYRLNVDESSGEATIKCFAVIWNPGKHEYSVESAELFGGDVSGPEPMPLASRSSYGTGALLSLDVADGAPNIDLEGNQQIGSLFQYNIRKPFKLDARSDLHEEFIRPSVSIKAFSSIDCLNEKREQIKFDRYYELTSSEFLPAGKITIRNQGRLVSNSRIDHLPAGKARKIRMGQDTSGYAVRNETKHEDHGVVHETFVELVIKNSRDIPWQYRYQEFSNRFDHDYTYSPLGSDNGMVFKGNSLNIVKIVGPREQAVFTYKITAVKKKN
ncbi:hypothetical protein ACOME3_000072 [Neoechinorhynchus agilis]